MSATRRPRIAVVSDTVHPWFKGGKERRYHELFQRLADHADIDVYTMQWWDGDTVHRDGNITYHAICPRLEVYVDGRRSIGAALRFALASSRLLRRRFDVLEADQIPYFPLFVLRVVATLKRTRLTASWHEVWDPDYWRTYLGWKGTIASWIERRAMRLPDEILANSDETGRRLRAELGEDAPVTVAPLGIDVEAVAAAAPAGSTTDLVVVGRLLAHKRIDLLLEAMAILHGVGEAVTCRVIGDGPELARLTARADTLGLAEHVEFRPDVDDHSELYALVKSARLFAFPSEREGFGIALLEALACGLPVVTTSAPDNLAVALAERSERGRVCAPDAPSLAGAIREALADDAGLAAPEDWVVEHDWNAVTRAVQEAMLA